MKPGSVFALALCASFLLPSRSARAHEMAYGVGSGARVAVVAPPDGEDGLIAMPPPNTRAEQRAALRAALEAARAEVQQCLADAGLRGTVTIRARVDPARGTTTTTTTRPASEAVRACADLAAQRHVLPLAANSSVAVTARITVRSARRPGPPGPPRPPTPPTTAFDGQVHATLDRDRAGLLRCVDAYAPGVTGTVILHLTLLTDGSVSMTGASLPPGAAAGPALTCLQTRIGGYRFQPAPPSSVSFDHTLTLGS